MTAAGRSREGWALLTRTLLRQRAALAALVTWSLVAAVPSLVSGRLVAVAVDRGFAAGRAVVGVAWLGVLAVAVVVGAVGARRVPRRLGEVVEPVRDRLVQMVVTGTLHRAVNDSDALGAPPPDATAVARLTGQTETVRDAGAGLLMGLHQVAFTVLAAAVGLLWLEPVIALLVLAPVLVALAVLAYLVRVLADRQHTLLLAGERVAAVVGDHVAAVRDVVACGAVPRALAECGVEIDAQVRAARAAARIGAVRAVVGGLGGQLPLVVVIAGAPWLLDGGRVSAGGLLGAVTYVTANLQPALRSAVQTAGGSAVLLAVTLRRLRDTTAPPAGADADAPRAGGRRPRCADELRAERLDFAYAPHAEPVVADLTVTLRPGDHLAVVGPSGIGKSTLANLLVGLAAPQRGRVLLGGVPLAELDQRWLRETVALIPQQAYVFTGTLRENLCYLRPDARAADLDAAVRAVGLTALLDRVGGYDAEVGSGSGLTSGERQLVALARVWLSAATVVVLDEATCHLDAAAEARAEDAFAERPGTLVVVAHRLSSALRAERILLMDGSRATLGTHEQLRRGSATYREMVGQWYGPVPRPDTVTR